MERFDIVVLGAGAGGMSAAIYAKRAGKSVLVLEKMFAGGQMLTIDKIANYPSFEMISGFELSEKMRSQVESLGVIIKNEEVISCKIDSDEKIIRTHKNEYLAKSIIIATGARSKPLNLKKEKEYLGRGLSYCATCDGKFFEGKTVAVVGTIINAKNDIKYLEKLASKVIFVTPEVHSNFGLDSTITQVCDESVIIDILGEEKIEQIVVKNQKTGEIKSIQTSALFVEFGKSPELGIFDEKIATDKNGFIIVDQKMQTNIKGVFAVGDVRSGMLKQIVTACADGAIAGTFA